MGALSLLREWPKLTIFSFAEQGWHLHGPGWLGWPKGEIWCTRISFRCPQLIFLLQGILCFQACWHTASSTQVPTLYSKSAFEMKALLTGMRLEGDQVVIFLKKRVLMGISQVPCVWRSLSCSSCIQLAAAGCKNVSKGAESSDSKSFLPSWVQPDNVQDTIGHLAAKVILDQTCFAPVSQNFLKQKLR